MKNHMNYAELCKLWKILKNIILHFKIEIFTYCTKCLVKSFVTY